MNPIDASNAGMPMRPDMKRAQPDDENGREVAKQFEAMFVQQIFTAMRKGSMSDNKDFGHNMFQEMFDEQIATHIAEQGLGLGETLFAELGVRGAQEQSPFVDKGDYGAVLTPVSKK